MPFITEEIWHILQTCEENETIAQLGAESSIMMQHMPCSVFYDQRMLDDCNVAREMIAGVRNMRNSRGLSPKEELNLIVVAGSDKPLNRRFDGIVRKLANVGEITYSETKPEGALGFMVGTMECFVPMKENIDVESELKKLEEELKYSEGFLKSVMKKLDNEKFVNGAPEKVVALERQKKADAEKKIEALKERIGELRAL
jgi:valyl-tRNA synthetase